VELFAGGAAVLFAKAPSEVEALNDVNGDLVNLYRVVQHHLEEFVRQFKWALSSRQMFKWLQEQPVDPLTDIQRAARFYYLQCSAFGGRVDGQSYGTATTSPPSLNLLRIEETLSAAHLRLAQVYIENLSWSDCMVRYDRPHTLFYLDPPYWQTEGYGVEFGFGHYVAIAEAMRTCKGKVVLSVNDHPDLLPVFEEFWMERVAISYTVGGGAGVERQELVICNYDASAGHGGLF
jgi:DNA adenine methylase